MTSSSFFAPPGSITAKRVGRQRAACGVVVAFGAAILLGYLPSQERGVHSAHLPCPRAEQGVVPGQDDGVGFYVLANQPGEFQVCHLPRVGLAFGYDLPVLGVQAQQVAVLHQQAAD